MLVCLFTSLHFYIRFFMQFQNPNAAWLFALLIIPVLIHLLAFRKRKHHFFSDISKIVSIQQRTSRNRKLKNIVLMTIRLAFIGSIVFALIKPISKSNENLIGNHDNISALLFIDNSFSMQLPGKDGNLLNEAKQKAEKIVRSLPDRTTFSILTHDFGKPIKWMDKKEVISEIERLEESTHSRSMSEIMKKQNQLFMEKDNQKKVCYFLSDFTFDVADSIAIEPSIDFFLCHIKGTNSQNISIDSLWFSEPIFEIDYQNNIDLKLKLFGQVNSPETSLSLYLDNRKIFTQIIGFKKNKSQILRVKLPKENPGWHTLTAKIDDAPLQFDDVLYAQFFIPTKQKILCIGSGQVETHLQRVFQDNYEISFVKNSDVLNISFENCALIIAHGLNFLTPKLSQKMSAYVGNGGKLLFLPSMIDGKPFCKGLLFINLFEYEKKKKKKSVCSSLNSSSSFFKNMFEGAPTRPTLPEVFSYRKIRTAEDIEPLISLSIDHAFLSRTPSGQGWIYVMATSLETRAGNFQEMGLFAPIMSRIAEKSESMQKHYFSIGESNIIPIYNPTISLENGLDIVFADQSYHLKPSYALEGNGMLQDFGIIDRPGFGQLMADDSVFQMVAYNYSRLESNIDPQKNEKALEKISAFQNVTIFDHFKSSPKEFSAQILGQKNLWQWFVVLALVFLTLESITLRFARR